MANQRVGMTVPFGITVVKVVKFTRVNTAYPVLNDYLRDVDRHFRGIESPSYAGWVPGEKGNYGEPYGPLTVYRIQKGDDTAFFVNTSPIDPQDAPKPASADVTFFSVQRDALEHLCHDWGFDASGIAENFPVQQFVKRDVHGSRDHIDM